MSFLLHVLLIDFLAFGIVSKEENPDKSLRSASMSVSDVTVYTLTKLRIDYARLSQMWKSRIFFWLHALGVLPYSATCW